MPDVPKIVRARLQALESGQGQHPDPDVLAAFSERSLPPREQSALLEHLSRCADCREIVALALPVSEALQPGLQVTGTSRRMWPVFRWVFASAGVVLVAIFGIVEYGHHAQHVRMAKNTPVPTLDQYDSQPASTQANSNQEQSATGAIPEKRRQESGTAAEVAMPPNTPARQRVARAPLPTSHSQQQMAANGPPSENKLSAPSANATRLGPQSQPAQGDLRSTDSLIAANRTPNQSVPPSTADAEVSRAKSAPAAQVASAAAPQARSIQALRIALPNWTVNAGRLQRSFDQGITWQDVNVTASPENGAGPDSAATLFRAVVAHGLDVWAGGTAAALYHSSDAGAHWTRVTPSSDTATLTGDILSLDFPNPQNGRISTSTGEIWITSDNGRSWQRQ